MAQPLGASEPNGRAGRRWVVPFFTIWTGQAFSLLGSMLVQFALVWWITKTTGSATVLATGSLVAMLPGIFLGPFAGALVDRWNRKRVMMVADGLIALMTLGLIFLYVQGVMQVWHIFAIMFLRSLGGAFHWPAMQASTSLMVPKEQLSRVSGMNQTLNGAMNVIAPPLGALLMEALPLQYVMAIDVVTAVIAITCLFFVHIPQPERQPQPAGAAKPSVLSDVAEGLRYMWKWPGLFSLALMATVINFLVTPAFVLMPILVTRHFGGQALQLGWLESGFGFGVVAGGLLLSVWGGFHRRILTSLAGLVGMGLGTLLVGLAPASALWLAISGMFVAGFMNPITNGPIFAIFQAIVAPEMQGRVFTVISSLAMAMSPLSMVIAGPVADAVGVQTWFIIGGIGCALMGLGAFAIPAIVHLEDSDHAVKGAGDSSVAGAAAEVAVD